jgi:uncharacterized protein YneF (UPF0154 family)
MATILISLSIGTIIGYFIAALLFTAANNTHHEEHND